MEEKVDYKEIAKFCTERDDKLIDSMTEQQAKDALKYINHRSHNPDGSSVLLVFDHDLVDFEKGENRKLGGFDCLSHTFADALEEAGIDLNKSI